MTLRPRLAFLTAALGLLATASAAAASPQRHTVDFNPGWRLHVGDPAGAPAPDFDDRAWKPVTLPRAWNEDDAFAKDIVDHSTGVAWYRKHFDLPADAALGKVFLEFEGARQVAEIFVNGRLVGTHENGVMAFGFDITAAIRPGENIVAVRTDNAWDWRERATGTPFQWADKNFNANYGGLPKNVRLHVTGPLYQTLPLYSNLGTTGVYVYASDFDLPARAATLHVESEIRNETDVAASCVLETVVTDPAGTTVATFTSEPLVLAPGATALARAEQRVTGLQFWSWGYGYLYDVATTVKTGDRAVDTVRTRTGFRQTAFRDGQFSLNGRVLHLKGYAQRTSNEWPAVGLSVPPWLSDFSNGLMVAGNANLVRWMHVTPWKQDVESCDRVGLLQAMPAGDSEEDVTGPQWDQRLALMRDAIVYNRNNPSVIFYESGNRGISEDHMREMKAIRDRYDPHGGRAIGCRDMLASPTAEYGGEMQYVTKSRRQPYWAMEYSRDEGARKFWDEFSPPFHKNGDGPKHKGQDARTYNRNQDSFALENVLRWSEYWRARPGTGDRVNAGGVNIIFSDSNTHHRGAENYRRSGEVDAMRLPKDGYWAHQVMWDGWVDVERPRVRLLGHWNYAPGTRKAVHAVSSAERVEFFLNGRSRGFGAQSNRFQFTLADVAWEPGVLRAVGYDAAGNILCEDQRETAGDPHALRLTAMTNPAGFRADGADLALIEVEVVDAAGRRCPTALNTVDFALSGPAEWRGGIAQGPGNFVLSPRLPVECGVNRVLIRSQTTPGPIVLTATCAGLESARLELATVGPTPFAAAGLPANLSRGPTPAGPSYRSKRVSIHPEKISTADSSAKAPFSCDDNETTTWASPLVLEQAWIDYAFERYVTLHEIDLKVANARYRGYPLRVTVDGTEVFAGTTAMGQGYVTLPLRPVRGRIVRIALTDAPLQNDSQRLFELSEKPPALQEGIRRVAPSLGLVEIEFYEAVPSGR